MTSRSLKIILAVSVALNVFAGAALITGVVGEALVDRQVSQERKSHRSSPVMEVIDDLDPAVRDEVRASLRAAALAARPDFHQAREARREAVALARAETFDAPTVTGLLVRSREAEQRGRAVLEGEAIRVLSGLDQPSRQKLAPILGRHGGKGRGPSPRSDAARAPEAARAMDGPAS